VTDERVPVEDWAAVEAALRGFDADVETSENRLVLCAGSARFAVSRDGTVETGMPLHGFTASGVDTLRVDHEAGHVRVSTGDVEYEFRVP
jgi:hypothetical protein